MNKLEAHLQDKQWIAFRDIPPCVRRIYDLILAVNVPGLKELWVNQYPGAYEQACEYWFNNTLEDVIGAVKNGRA